MKTIISGLIIAALLVGGFFLLKNYFDLNGQDNGLPENETENNFDPSVYFEERMTTLAIEDVGQPIEGFDSDLLIMAYPGLEPGDFEGVEGLNGHYEVIDGEVVFLSDGKSPVTSADGMVTSEGYATLLLNVSTRLGVQVTDEQRIDDLIEQINTGERIETRIDQGASALGVRVIPHEILEDSRCPIDVTCIQAGTVRVQATLESGLGSSAQEFELDQTITTEAEEVTLVRVEPAPYSDQKIEPDDYVFYFEIVKRD